MIFRLTLRHHTALCLAALCWCTAATAQQPVRGSAKSMGAFTRVQLASPVAAEVAQSDTSVTFRYDEAVSADVGALASRLAPLGASVRQVGPESIVVTVPAGTRLRSFMGNGVAGVDITPAAPGATAPAPAPEPETQSAPSRPAPAKDDIPKAPAAAPATVSYEATPDFLALTATLKAPGKATLRRTGNTLDILTNEPVPLALPGLSASAKQYVRSIAPRSQNGKHGLRVVMNGSYAPQLAQKGQTVRLTLSRADAKTTPPPVKESVKEQATPAPASDAEAIARAGKADAATPPASATKETATKATPAEKPAEAETKPAAQPAPAQAEGFSIVTEGESVILTMPKPKGSGLTVFSRNGYVWIAMNKTVPVKSSNLNVPESDLVGEASLIPNPHGTIVNFVERRPVEAVVGFDNDQWRIRMAPTIAAEPRGIAIHAENTADGNGIKTLSVASEEGFASPFSMDDPLTGERIVFMPVAGEEAVREPRRLVEMALPRTFRGAVAILNTDAINWKSVEKQVIFQHSGGSFIGSMPPAAPPGATTDPSAPRPFESEDQSVPAARRAYLARLLATPNPAEHAALRLRYFHTLMALGDYNEALGFGQYLTLMHPDYAAANRVDAALAVLNLFRNRDTEAVALLSGERLKGDAALAPLLSLAKMLEGKEEGAFADGKTALEAIRPYAPAIRARLLRRLVDHYFYHLKPQEAEALLTQLKEKELAAYTDPTWFRLAQAEWLSYMGRTNESIGTLRELAGMVENREARARATYRLIASQLRQKQITRDDAIKGLENIRNTWRQAYPEVPALLLLSEQYLLAKDYRSALDVMRYLTTEYKAFPGRDDTLKKMSDTFLYLFNNNGAKDMPPLDALTLYYEFRELTPTGPEGDVMIRNLADRLVEVELLERAAALLTHQIRFRVKGEERARVAARLALIHLMNHNPKLAIEVIDYTNAEDLPEELVLARNRIKAQAYVDMDDFQGALDQLAEDPTRAGQSLRLEVLWRMQNWPEVINVLSFDLQDREKIDEPLDAQEVQNVLRLALAYVYTNESARLKDLRERFMPMLNDDTLKTQFDFLTREEGAPDYSNMQAVATRIGQFEGFLGTLKRKVQDEGLSKAVE